MGDENPQEDKEEGNDCEEDVISSQGNDNNISNMARQINVVGTGRSSQTSVRKEEVKRRR